MGSRGFPGDELRRGLRLYLKTKAKAWCGLADSILRASLLLTDSICRHGLSFRGACRFEWSPGFDERFDRFWTELQESQPSRFLSSRRKDTLAWHFRGALEQKRVWILTACDGPRLVGYAILQRKGAQSLELTRMMLVDLGGDPKLAPAMIAFALDRCRQERIHASRMPAAGSRRCNRPSNALRTIVRWRPGAICISPQTANWRQRSGTLRIGTPPSTTETPVSDKYVCSTLSLTRNRISRECSLRPSGKGAGGVLSKAGTANLQGKECGITKRH